MPATAGVCKVEGTRLSLAACGQRDGDREPDDEAAGDEVVVRDARVVELLSKLHQLRIARAVLATSAFRASSPSFTVPFPHAMFTTAFQLSAASVCLRFYCLVLLMQTGSRLNAVDVPKRQLYILLGKTGTPNF